MRVYIQTPKPRATFLVFFWRSLFTFSRQFLESLFSAFLLHHYPLFTSPFPFTPLLSPSLLHFELLTSLSSLVPTLSIHWYHHHHHPTPCCEFCRPRLFIFFLLLNFNSILNPNTGGNKEWRVLNFIICASLTNSGRMWRPTNPEIIEKSTWRECNQVRARNGWITTITPREVIFRAISAPLIDNEWEPPPTLRSLGIHTCHSRPQSCSSNRHSLISERASRAVWSWNTSHLLLFGKKGARWNKKKKKKSNLVKDVQVCFSVI